MWSEAAVFERQALRLLFFCGSRPPFSYWPVEMPYGQWQLKLLLQRFAPLIFWRGAAREVQIEDAALKKTYFELSAQLSAGKPLEYLIGQSDFAGQTWSISESVLIPRPETETLLSLALQYGDRCQREDPVRVLELGVGSGVLILSLALCRPTWNCSGIERCPDALKIALKNRLEKGLERVPLVEEDWWNLARADKASSFWDARWDVVVANPPYVEEKALHAEMKQLAHEPRAALFSEEGGLKDIRHIVKHADRLLRPGGALLIEHGHLQAEGVARSMALWQLVHVRSFSDANGLSRVTVGRYQE